MVRAFSPHRVWGWENLGLSSQAGMVLGLWPADSNTTDTSPTELGSRCSVELDIGSVTSRPQAPTVRSIPAWGDNPR
jgi:hypothetical protein